MMVSPSGLGMAELPGIHRQWLLLRMLSRRGPGRTIQELADEFGTCERTIRRDFELLGSIGFSFVAACGPHNRKTWRLDTDDILAGLVFNVDELAALYLGRRFLEPLAGTFVWEAAQEAFKKIRVGLGRDKLRYLEQLAAAFHHTPLGRSDYSDRDDVIEGLMTAIEDRRVTRMLYHSLRTEQPATVEVHPYGLIWHRSTLYLVAFAPEHDELRHYKIDRVRDVEVLKSTFSRPPDFHLQKHLRDTFGVYHGDGPPHTVRIRFTPAVARYVQEHHWHASQTLTEQPDGGVVLEMQLAQLEEVKSWILSFGAHAEVDAPAELREMIAQDLATLTGRYGSNKRAKR
jgi:predicted DNA-binding transcriptional regulator YafY